MYPVLDHRFDTPSYLIHGFARRTSVLDRARDALQDVADTLAAVGA